MLANFLTFSKINFKKHVSRGCREISFSCYKWASLEYTLGLLLDLDMTVYLGIFLRWSY